MRHHEYNATYKSTGGVRRIGNALRYSCAGLKSAIEHEAAFRQELLLAALLLPCAFWLGQTAMQRVVLIAALLFVLVVELLNSAIEAIADAISVEWHPLLGRAKDLGSAAVLLAIVTATAVWAVVILQRVAA